MSPQSHEGKPNQLPGLDLLKFSMSIVIVALHAGLFLEVSWLTRLVTPIYGSAVPVFFTVSAYLYFAKLARWGRDGEWGVLGHYVKRLGVFYLFWFVIMLPVTIAVRKWHVHFDAAAFLRALFLDSTFRGSYFVMALMLGVPVIHLARKVLDAPVVLFLSLALHLAFRKPLVDLLPWPAWLGDFSFVSSLIWLALGALLADMAAVPQPAKRIPRVARWLAVVAIYILMCFPGPSPMWALLRPAFVAGVFCLASEIRPQNSALCLWLRHLSILVFVTHFVFLSGMDFLAKIRPVLDNGFLRFGIILCAALAVSCAFLWLKEKRFFHWLSLGL